MAEQVRVDRTEHQRLDLQFQWLRRIIGGLGMGLPLLLPIVNGLPLEPSVSDYYSTPHGRDVFVGILFAVGTFLLAYKGYDLQDDLCGIAAGSLAVGVAVFPNNDSSTKTIHFVCAILLFAILAYFSIFLFTKSGESQTDEKKRRNVVYKICGWTIVGCLAVAGLVVWLVPDDVVHDRKLVFWLETVMLIAFGFAWLVKGETLWKDED